MSEEIPSPTSALIPEAKDLLALAIEVLSRARADQSDLPNTLAAFLFTLHLKDYSGRKRGQLSSRCPFWETVEEIGNGTKHLSLSAKRYPKPHVSRIKQIASYGSAAYGVGPYGGSYIGVVTRRMSGESEEWFSAVEILDEVLVWWINELDSSSG